jgi:transposase
VLSLPPTVRLFLCNRPVDMRKGFDSLAQLTRDAVGEDPLAGHLFLFLSRRGDRLKILYWDADGFVLWYKRLEQGVFRFPKSDADRVEMTASDLQLVLSGVDPASVRRLPRYRVGASA